MPDIVLTTFNARYSHAAFGLRYILANMGPLAPQTTLREFDIHRNVVEVVSELLALKPRVVGMGVYIWNVALATRVAREMKKQRPDVLLVVGGPEVSHEQEQQEICAIADYVVCGEADVAFGALCADLLEGRRPTQRIIHVESPDPASLALPYDLYDEADVAHRLIYVETSRGCPYRCEYCVSCLDPRVRYFLLKPVLNEIGRLLDRGVRQLKFVDRTFNVDIGRCNEILGFLLKRIRPGLSFHFEMVPERFPEELRAMISRFPPGVLRFEVGVQTLNPEVSARVARPLNPGQVLDNLRFLCDEARAHVHVDLIAGLPGESLDSFAAGFDQLVRLRPHELQIGILKRLRGTPITRHDAEWGMAYNREPPYDIVSNRLLDAATVARIKRFARCWDLVANSRRFPTALPRLWADNRSPFAAFMEWTEWLFEKEGRLHGIALNDLADDLFDFLTRIRKMSPEEVSQAIWTDYGRVARRKRPRFMEPS